MKTKRMTLVSMALAGVIAVAACTPTRTTRATGQVIDDGTVTVKVKAALIEDPITKAYEINVQTFRGVVKLAGFVDNTEQKQQASKVASGVGGVVKVENDLSIKAN